MKEKLNLRQLSFAEEFPYKGFLGSEHEVYTDNNILWGEIRNHTELNDDGSGIPDFCTGHNKWLPEKAEELGYKQAVLEAFLGLGLSGATDAERMDFLGLQESDCEALHKSSIIRFRIFPAITMQEVRALAAKSFVIGYNRAYEDLCKKDNPEIDMEAAFKKGQSQVRKELRSILQKELFDEYCEIYHGAI